MAVRVKTYARALVLRQKFGRKYKKRFVIKNTPIGYVVKRPTIKVYR